MDLSINTMTFTDIENKFNSLVFDLVIPDDIDPSSIRQLIYEKLEKSYTTLKFSLSTYSYTEFIIDIPYCNDHQGITQYDTGSVLLHFSISVKKTSEIQKVSKYRNKTVYTRSNKPIKFLMVDVATFCKTFKWQNSDDPSNLNLIDSGSRAGTSLTLNHQLDTVDKVLGEIPKMYDDQYYDNTTGQFMTRVALVRDMEYIKPHIPEQLWNQVTSRDATLDYKSIFNEVSKIIEKKFVIKS